MPSGCSIRWRSARRSTSSGDVAPAGSAAPRSSAVALVAGLLGLLVWKVVKGTGTRSPARCRAAALHRAQPNSPSSASTSTGSSSSRRSAARPSCSTSGLLVRPVRAGGAADPEGWWRWQRQGRRLRGRQRERLPRRRPELHARHGVSITVYDGTARRGPLRRDGLPGDVLRRTPAAASSTARGASSGLKELDACVERRSRARRDPVAAVVALASHWRRRCARERATPDPRPRSSRRSCASSARRRSTSPTQPSRTG